MKYIITMLSLLAVTTDATAQRFCPPYCGPPYENRSRGPLGDYIDRNYYCQGPGRGCTTPYPGYQGWRPYQTYPMYPRPYVPPQYYYGPMR